MRPDNEKVFSYFHGVPTRVVLCLMVVVAAGTWSVATLNGAAGAADAAWRSLPLITDGKVDPNWIHVGYGRFAVDNGTLRTDCDPKGLGLLVYKKEKLGNCQIRVVYKAQNEKSNAGVYVRLADGILDRAKNPGPAFERNAKGEPSAESLKQVKAAAEREEGAWYAVHHGYEVQIQDSGDPLHRTGAIYSLAPASAKSKKPAGEWQTMIITLAGDRIFVNLNGEDITRFDPASPTVPPRKEWSEPKREPKRPEVGYLGLQNHDPADVIWYKEVSVRPLPASAKK